jgi:tripartite-type tricarboxylate transporter receptor subunit TctC
LKSRRTFIKLSAAALAASAAPRIASAAQGAWPSRPIRAIVPFSAGSTIDILGRIVTDALAIALGQPIVIDNRGGAGGSIGTAVVAKAEPDGHTILINASAHTVAPAAYPNLPYDPLRDIAAVAMIGVVPNVIVIAPSKGIKTLRQLADAGKKGGMSFASAGVASASHWGAERFRLSAGFSATHVPFKGGIEALTDVMAGRVDWMSVGVASAMQFIQQGRLIPLGVATRKRSATLPDVPTTLEAGFADSDYTYWNAVLAPAKTPRAIIDRLHAETTKVLKLPAVQEKLKPLGVEPMPLTPQEFDAMIRKEIQLNIALAKQAGLKLN